jgi:transposase
MGKKNTERRVYNREFIAEMVALTEKWEKPVSQIVVDFGVSESVLFRWVQPSTGGLPSFPGHGRPRDEELARLHRETKAIREDNEILKKAAVILAQTNL